MITPKGWAFNRIIEIIHCREDNGGKTYQQIADKFGFSLERARQLYCRGKKLQAKGDLK